jgi:hypothetical protein
MPEIHRSLSQWCWAGHLTAIAERLGESIVGAAVEQCSLGDGVNAGLTARTDAGRMVSVLAAAASVAARLSMLATGPNAAKAVNRRIRFMGS